MSASNQPCTIVCGTCNSLVTAITVFLRDGTMMRRTLTGVCGLNDSTCVSNWLSTSQPGSRRIVYYDRRNPLGSLRDRLPAMNVAAVVFIVIFSLPLLFWLLLVIACGYVSALKEIERARAHSAGVQFPDTRTKSGISDSVASAFNVDPSPFHLAAGIYDLPTPAGGFVSAPAISSEVINPKGPPPSYEDDG
eukprot:c17269_g1_i3.p2 GENE.c17269_g1_i3~~c17269_g1_i3.p2  ORF type:complete len:192 (+),score=1.94 c17269_g1_i3:626-1201(+)